MRCHPPDHMAPDQVEIVGWQDDADLPTPRSTLAARYVRVLLTGWHCRHQRDADLQSLIDSGRGDVPLTRLRWRCAQCRSDRVDMVVTSRDRVMPWRA